MSMEGLRSSVSPDCRIIAPFRSDDMEGFCSGTIEDFFCSEGAAAFDTLFCCSYLSLASGLDGLGEKE